jgi:hypothetical protein
MIGQEIHFTQLPPDIAGPRIARTRLTDGVKLCIAKEGKMVLKRIEIEMKQYQIHFILSPLSILANHTWVQFFFFYQAIDLNAFSETVLTSACNILHELQPKQNIWFPCSRELKASVRRCP